MMQVSALGGMRAQMRQELLGLAKELAIAEGLIRTQRETDRIAIGKQVERKRPIAALVEKILKNNDKHAKFPDKFEHKYAQYIVRLRFHLARPMGKEYITAVRTFKQKHSDTVLPELLELAEEAPAEARAFKMALATADNCIWNSRRAEKLQKAVDALEKGLKQADHKHTGPSETCPSCSLLREKLKVLEAHRDETRLGEIHALRLWNLQCELKAEKTSMVQNVLFFLMGGIGGAMVGGAAAVIGNTGLTLDSIQTGATMGPGVVSSAKSVFAGEPQFLDRNETAKTRFQSLSLRLRYAFQSESSGAFGRYFLAFFSGAGSHTVGFIVIQVGEVTEEVTLFFNSKAHFPIPPAVFGQLCKLLWKKMEEGKLPPQDCFEILRNLEQGEFNPGNKHPVIKGLINERLSFCSDRLKRYCLREIALHPPKKVEEDEKDETLAGFVLLASQDPRLNEGTNSGK